MQVHIKFFKQISYKLERRWTYTSEISYSVLIIISIKNKRNCVMNQKFYVVWLGEISRHLSQWIGF